MRVRRWQRNGMPRFISRIAVSRLAAAAITMGGPAVARARRSRAAQLMAILVAAYADVLAGLEGDVLVCTVGTRIPSRRRRGGQGVRGLSRCA